MLAPVGVRYLIVAGFTARTDPAHLPLAWRQMTEAISRLAHAYRKVGKHRRASVDDRHMYVREAAVCDGPQDEHKCAGPECRFSQR
jgi:hypothetical protein